MRDRLGLSVALAAVAVGGMAAWPAEQGAVDPSTREMGLLLAELASKVDPRTVALPGGRPSSGNAGGGPRLATPHHRAASAAFLLRVRALARRKDHGLPGGHRRPEGGRDRECAGSLGTGPERGRVAESDGLHAPGRGAELSPGQQSRLLPPSHPRRRRPSEARGRHASHRGAEGHPRRGPRQPPGEMAAERGPHDARELPRRCLQARPDSARRLRLGVPLASLRERREAGRCRRVWPGWRSHPRRLRQRRPARPHGVPLGLRGPDALLPQPGRRHVRGPHGERRPHRGDGRPEHDPGRLRQRWLRRRAGAARRVDGARRAIPALPAAKQGQRDLHGRHEGRRVAGAPRADPDRDLARLRRGRLARPLRGQRDSRRRIRGAEPLRAVPQQPRWHIHERRATRRASTSSAS